MTGSQGSFDVEGAGGAGGPVECLGMTFESDGARREYFRDILRRKLQDPAFRSIEGFPLGEDEDILALSDPPYYTACPNPFIEDFIRHHGKPYDPAADDYRREPFAADVSEGKNDPIYNAHSYHTKVPHKAIMRYILHYTEPGDVVFDGFCGTGMTGVAAQLCGDSNAVKALGYEVRKNGTVLDEQGMPFSKIGPRPTVLNDLSPAATFIAYNYNTPVEVRQFEAQAKRILEQVEQECGWMYLTLHAPPSQLLQELTRAPEAGGIQGASVGQEKPATQEQTTQELALQDPRRLQNDPALAAHRGRINYTVWSDVFVCPHCAGELVFWEEAVDKEAGKLRDEFPCPHCKALLTKRNMERAWETRFDRSLDRSIQQAKQVPVLIEYSVGKRRFEKKPDRYDLALIETIEQSEIPHWFPNNPMMFEGEQWGDTWRAGIHFGITHVHHFYTKRNLWVLAILNDMIAKTDMVAALRYQLASLIIRQSKLTRFLTSNYFHGGGGWVGSPLSGTLYVPSFSVEVAPFQTWSNRIPKSMVRVPNNTPTLCCVDTVSTTDSTMSDLTADYIFTDPPFGANLMYSELNFIREAWLKVFTNNEPEAIQNKTQGKGLLEYQQLMTGCFEEYYRVLKPGRWMTVVFHNSQNRVWNAIQEALQRAGFVIADVRTLDKQQGTFKQVTSASAVKQDLVISAYRPNGGLEERFKLEAGTAKGVWDFTRTHLAKLPVFVQKEGQAEVLAERQDYLLFDRMVAFHVQRGVTVPLSAAEYYGGLRTYFPERDGMFFLPEQASEYDRKRTSVHKVMQLTLFVTDEASAIQWVRGQLSKKPQTFQDLQPQYMQEVKSWARHETQMELSDILDASFLRYDGDGDVPGPIHSYLSTNYRSMRNLEKSSPALIERAQGCWYVPDPRKEADLEKVRLRALLREFEQYRESKGRLKVVRAEALRAGFKKCYDSGDYQTIVALAERIPQKLLQEDSALLMYYDVALLRTGG
jgi:DNA modification methylase